MIFEVSNDLVPILLSVSLYISFIAVHVMSSMTKEYVVRHRYLTNREIQSSLFLISTEDSFSEKLEEKQSFITRIIKRKEAPEDDGEYHFSSMKQHENENTRGGKHLWSRRNILYSPSLGNMVIL
ncbi:hypothetical protein [Evansella tamaricis]|uniref:Uncharacterized protein n=1 Tax=Evansella tamaricis TaxID=2069301 RepID=A0ABS6JAA3_9BACI|nr:hypothetical protein [Evansella tamaricis]MBU9710448.1 hypothetical protein [Evansella tamaricis]